MVHQEYSSTPRILRPPALRMLESFKAISVNRYPQGPHHRGLRRSRCRRVGEGGGAGVRSSALRSSAHHEVTGAGDRRDSAEQALALVLQASGEIDTRSRSVRSGVGGGPIAGSQRPEIPDLDRLAVRAQKLALE